MISAYNIQSEYIANFNFLLKLFGSYMKKQFLFDFYIFKIKLMQLAT